MTHNPIEEDDEGAERVERALRMIGAQEKQKVQKDDAPISEDELLEMEERVKAATKGPWLTEMRDGYITGNITSEHHKYSGSPKVESKSITHHFSMTAGDAFFIAYARSDMPRLVAEVRRLRARLRGKDS